MSSALNIGLSTGNVGIGNRSYNDQLIPASNGRINGVNITALNERTRTSRASAEACVSSWVTRASAANNSWWSVTWAPELSIFVAVSLTGTGNRVMTSPDGITWMTRTSAADNQWISVVWASELSIFVAVSVTGTGNRVMTSPDGINWTTRASAADNAWHFVCWAPELFIFVAIAESGTGNRVMTSPNGIIWTTRTSAADNNWYTVCWAPELSIFVAVAFTGPGNRVMTSPDGITWRSASTTNNQWLSVTWSPEVSLFVAVANTGTNDRVMTSADGITWITRVSAANNNWYSVIWALELSLFVAVAWTGTGNRIMCSPDGITWTTKASAADVQWTSVCWASELSSFVAVSQSGTGNRVMTSAIGMPNSKSVVKALPSQMTVLANGNVGIGTTVPLNGLHLYTTTSSSLLLESGEGTGQSFKIVHNSSENRSSITFLSENGSDRRGAILFNTNPTSGGNNPERMRITSDGNMGIGVINPQVNLQVQNSVRINSVNATYNKSLILFDGNSAESAATGTEFYGFGVNGGTLRYQVEATSGLHRFYGAATQYGYVNNATGFVNTFTGQHRSFPEPSIASLTATPVRIVGLIACASGRHVSVNEKIPVSGKAAITISEAVPTVRLSAVECDPSVFGVISDVEDPSDRKDHYGSFVATHEAIPGDTRLFINSLGEGALWVSDAGGPVTNGDFITTSVVPGYGSKQSDSVLRNYTVAKITMDCDFSGAQVPQRRIKKKTVTLAVEEIVKAERSVEEVREIVEYDIDAQRYVRKKVTETRTVTDTLYDEFDLYDETGAVVGKHKVERRATVTKTMEENDLDAYGNIQWEDATDAEGTPITEVPYELRYLTQNGDELSQADYNVRKESRESVYRAAFLACTYHCG